MMDIKGDNDIVINFNTKNRKRQNILKGKVALITGAGRRIGRAIAIALAKEGMHIIVHDRPENEGMTIGVCKAIAKQGSKSWSILADLERPEQYTTLISRAIETAGSLQVLINNASLFQPGSLRDAEFHDLMQHIQVNSWTPLVLSRDFARQAKRGSIINFLDTKIIGYDRNHFAYQLSKQMFSSITKMCALEFSPHITVNGVAPGLILPPEGKNTEYLRLLAKNLPLGHQGGLQDITDVVLYLLKSDFVTGQIIYVDGGWHLLEKLHGSHYN